jgi:uncharacterized protein
LFLSLPASVVTCYLVIAVLAVQAPLREYTGAYQWTGGGFLYLQLWSELTGTNQLVAFDETGEVRALTPGAHDRFAAGQGDISFRRDSAGAIASLAWRTGGTVRTAHRTPSETHVDVSFDNGDVHLAGTLINPVIPGRRRHPAVILVHASGAQDRSALLPFAHFLVRRGVAVLGYDKRGVGGSTGDWRTASFDDLAGDVVAAFQYLKARREIDSTQIGLLGWSQAGWVMPLAAVRARDIAFLISISGAAIPAAETTIDQARNEMLAGGMKPETVDEIVRVMALQYDFARSGTSWAEYVAGRERLVSRFGRAPDNFPASPGDPYWAFIRRLYFYDPAPTLRRLRLPVLALFGELDNNIVAPKNSAAWEAALRAGGHTDHTIRTLPRANHLMLEAKTGSNAEMPSLTRFVPDYFAVVETWLAARVPKFQRAK